MLPFLEAKGLSKSFGSIRAVDGVDLVVQPGEVLGFLGPNGAGKSTTMKLITGFLDPDAGEISICGHDMLRDPLSAKRELGYLPEGAPGYPDMAVIDFLRFLGDIRGMAAKHLAERIDYVIEVVHLGGVLHQDIETLSKGFRRRVGIAVALLHDPPLLILDEPTDGLDPNQKHEIRTLIRELSHDKAVVLSTHILEEVGAVCSRAVIINRGKVVFDGTPTDLEARAPEDSSAPLDVVFREITTSDLTEVVGVQP
jgi:ABC-2 type transport system ATP-binding protein